MNAGQHLELGYLKMFRGTYPGENRLCRPCRAVNVEAKLDHAFDHLLYIFFRSLAMHCNYHRLRVTLFT